MLTSLNDTQTYPRRALLDGMNNENATCMWTPGHLDDELYTLWLSSSRDARSNWTTSPPWRLKESVGLWVTFSPLICPQLINTTAAISFPLGRTYCHTHRCDAGSVHVGTHHLHHISAA
jgi:hypothetical protein